MAKEPHPKALYQGNGFGNKECYIYHYDAGISIGSNQGKLVETLSNLKPVAIIFQTMDKDKKYAAKTLKPNGRTIAISRLEKDGVDAKNLDEAARIFRNEMFPKLSLIDGTLNS